MFSKIKKNKAFTLIELIVVIAILAVLVLLAAPKFLGHTEEARLAQIKNDIKVHEDVIEGKRVKANIKGENYLADNFNSINAEDLKNLRDEGTLYDKRGLVLNTEEFNEEYFKIIKGLINTKLKGTFYVSDSGKVYYHQEGLNGNDNSNETEPGFSDIDLDMEDDFQWFTLDEQTIERMNNEGIGEGIYTNTDGEKGFYVYIGTGKETVEIPHIIKGTPMTSYYGMFYGSGEDVKKVISTNKNITNMNLMFNYSLMTELDLSELYTSNVTSMTSMFSSAQITELNLSSIDTSNVVNMKDMFSYSIVKDLDITALNTSKVKDMSRMFYNTESETINFDGLDTSNVENMSQMFSWIKTPTLDLSTLNTSKVTDMSRMFEYSKTTSLDLSNFDTSSVTDMDYMFSESKATSLDLSSFNTSNVEDMDYMFSESKATTGYARTEDDAYKFNNSSNKPSGLTFIVKPKQ